MTPEQRFSAASFQGSIVHEIALQHHGAKERMILCTVFSTIDFSTTCNVPHSNSLHQGAAAMERTIVLQRTIRFVWARTFGFWACSEMITAVRHREHVSIEHKRSQLNKFGQKSKPEDSRQSCPWSSHDMLITISDGIHRF